MQKSFHVEQKRKIFFQKYDFIQRQKKGKTQLHDTCQTSGLRELYRTHFTLHLVNWLIKKR